MKNTGAAWKVGPAHPCWRGGIHMRNGYRELWIDGGQKITRRAFTERTGR